MYFCKRNNSQQFYSKFLRVPIVGIWQNCIVIRNKHVDYVSQPKRLQITISNITKEDQEKRCTVRKETCGEPSFSSTTKTQHFETSTNCTVTDRHQPTTMLNDQQYSPDSLESSEYETAESAVTLDDIVSYTMLESDVEVDFLGSAVERRRLKKLLPVPKKKKYDHVSSRVKNYILSQNSKNKKDQNDSGEF